MERINILEILKKSRKYDIALLTTFNFEISFFEKCILNKLYDNGIRKVSVFVDSKEYNKAIDNIELSYIGKRYYATPVNINSSFHPKIILLLGKNKARLIVGSWNLTTNGYFINNEIGNVFDYDENTPQTLSLIQSAMNYFIDINEKTDKRDNNLIQSIKNYPYYRLNNEYELNTQLLTNVNEAIIDQVYGIIPDEVTEIDIAVPYFDKEVSALKQISEKFNKSRIKLYIQNERNTFPEKYQNNYELNLYNKFIDNGSYHFYHGKVIRFITKDNSFVLYGSANCTQAALFKSINSGGNAECDFISKGTINEYDYFFNNFCIEENIDFKSELLTVDLPIKKNYSFMNNYLNTLTFKFKEKYDNLKVYIHENELDFSYDENLLNISIPIELLNELSGIFTIVFKYNEEEETSSCYLNDIEEIEHNRNLEVINRIPNINVNPDINAEPDKYLKDRIELISRFSFMYDIFNEKLDYYIQDDEKEDSEITEEKEDFIDYDFKLSDEVQIKQKTLDQIFKANHSVFHSFRNHLLSFKNSNAVHNEEEKPKEPITRVVRERRNATTNEKSFARMVKGITKDMLSKTNSGKLDFSNYLQCVVSIFDVYNKFMIRENVYDMFNDKEVIETEYELIYELTSKFNCEISEEEKEMYLWLSLACIIQTNYINTTSDKVDYKKNLRNRDLLRLINEKFNIRENYNNYLDVVLGFINEKESIIDSFSAITYIETLFDYKTDNQLMDLLVKEFGEDSTIKIGDNNVEIIVSTDNISKFMKLNSVTISEIRKYYKNSTNILDKIYIKVINLKTDYPSTADPINVLEYELDEINYICHQIITRRSGIKDTPKDIKI